MPTDLFSYVAVLRNGTPKLTITSLPVSPPSFTMAEITVDLEDRSHFLKRWPLLLFLDHSSCFHTTRLTNPNRTGCKREQFRRRHQMATSVTLSFRAAPCSLRSEPSDSSHFSLCSVSHTISIDCDPKEFYLVLLYEGTKCESTDSVLKATGDRTAGIIFVGTWKHGGHRRVAE